MIQPQTRFRAGLTAAWRRFSALQRDGLRCCGVTLSQCLALDTLRQEGPLPPSALAERLGLDASTVTRVVDVLCRDGLIRRTRPEGDRRSVRLSLTRRGAGLARRLEGQADACCARILERVPRDRRDDVIQNLHVLVEALDECC